MKWIEITLYLMSFLGLGLTIIGAYKLQKQETPKPDKLKQSNFELNISFRRSGTLSLNEDKVNTKEIEEAFNEIIKDYNNSLDKFEKKLQQEKDKSKQYFRLIFWGFIFQALPVLGFIMLVK